MDEHIPIERYVEINSASLGASEVTPSSLLTPPPSLDFSVPENSGFLYFYGMY